MYCEAIDNESGTSISLYINQFDVLFYMFKNSTITISIVYIKIGYRHIGIAGGISAAILMKLIVCSREYPLGKKIMIFIIFLQPKEIFFAISMLGKSLSRVLFKQLCSKLFEIYEFTIMIGSFINTRFNFLFKIRFQFKNRL